VVGPVAISSIVLVFAAANASAGDPVAMVTSALGIASSVATLIAFVAMAVGLAGLPVVRPALRQGFPRLAWLVATVGTILTAGGYWSSVFVQPSLGQIAPEAVRTGLASVTAGFVVSYLLLGVGWALVGVALLRAKLVGASGWFLIVTALVACSPLPFRFVPLAVAVTIACGLRLRRTA
jgi:hypothetical protein